MPFFRNGLRRSVGACSSAWTSPSRIPASPNWTRRCIHYDGRNRLSNFWSPTQRKPKGDRSNQNGDIDGHELLLRAGFLRQSASGIFHLLPLGLRVQDKIEKLIDKHMTKLGASKTSLSSLSSEDLWRQSGRLDGRDSEFFRLQDRKEARFLLSPTHEEEITKIVADAVHSYKDLPLRLYQITRKYRDEARPRQGLLRGREFVMKDLYTFDTTESQARETYEAVRQAYVAFLTDLRLPYLVANADSGNMGGKLSHEYHFASDRGEDTIIGCDTCDYSVNEELFIAPLDKAPSPPVADNAPSMPTKAGFFFAVSKDRRKLLWATQPAQDVFDFNIHALKEIFPEIDTSFDGSDYKAVMDAWISGAEEDGEPRTRFLLVDSRNEGMEGFFEQWRSVTSLPGPEGKEVPVSSEVLPSEIDGKPVLLTKARDDDPCPSCEQGKLKLQQATEIGHTFHLGTRYSQPMQLQVLDANNEQVSVSMGCHGIGVSRLIGAIATLLADKEGLGWPMAIAPFEAVLISTPSVDKADVESLYDQLHSAAVDMTIDDRDRAMGWKLNDSDLVGYPFVVVMGRAWADKKALELQCRRLGIKEEVQAADVVSRIAELSQKL
ncbi:prolyl-tRNA synthetase [Hortaea werneckii]|nr:prolyl-tRNA synthetase [Hortaea werneckii]KAI7309589.1 prolyl-tRNA synthetase [Hortaea werneckii]